MRQLGLWCAMLGLTALFGCADGLRIGDTWLMGPVNTPGATRAEIVRYRLGDSGKSRVDEQKLSIELATGYTALSDPDGRTIPAQLPAQTAERVREVARQKRLRPIGIEGEAENDWILMDYSDVVVHLMMHKVREFYSLERLWDDRLRETTRRRRDRSSDI